MDEDTNRLFYIGQRVLLCGGLLYARIIGFDLIRENAVIAVLELPGDDRKHWRYLAELKPSVV